VKRSAVALTVCLSLSGCVVVGSSDSSSDSNGFGFLFLLLPLFLVFGLFRLMRPRRGGRLRQFSDRPHESTSPSVNMLRAELSVLSDDVLRLEPLVTLKPEARDDFEAALHRYRVAQAALDDTEAPVDLVRVQRVVDEAGWSMSRARAILDGRPPPPPPPQLQHQGRRGEPAVDVDEGNHPRYVGSPASFQSGWFAFGPGLFGGLLMGSMLGGGFGDRVSDEGEYDAGEYDTGESDWTME
jgi:hypothetical protein